jgi:hypothetical protein
VLSGDASDKENSMKISYRTFAATFGALVLALLCAPVSKAQCGTYQKTALPSSWSGQPAMLLRAALINDDHSNEPSIVGFWHIKMLIGVNVIDAGTQQWHSDGTEVIDSGGRSPLIGNVCFGVWKQVGERSYKLNHRGIGFDPAGSAVNGVDSIVFDVTLSRDGNSYSGTFTIFAYDTDGNSMGPAVKGTATGTRITVDDTSPGSLF